MPFPEEVKVGVPAWRERALARALDTTTARSVQQLERLVGAARDLADATGNAEFTVAQVTERAGLSLKTFYRCFAGKDDLLLALIEEDSRTGAGLLRDHVRAAAGGPDRLRAYLTGVLRLAGVPGATGYAGVLVREHRRLAEVRPDELRAALAPMVDLLTTAIPGASGADRDPNAELVFDLVLSGVQDVVLGRADPDGRAEELWTFCWYGLAGPGRPAARRRR